MFGLFGNKEIKKEFDELKELVHLEKGQTVGEIGAGEGEMTLLFGEGVGEDGHVYATEADIKKLRKLRTKTAEITNIEVRDADQEKLSLDEASCDVMLMRKVYHHIENPEIINKQIFETLKPGGKLVVIDFPGRWWLSLVMPVKGVPEDRHGHGIKKEIIKKEMDRAGFVLSKDTDDWFKDSYCLVFEKPR